jgi:hypothetical protein
MSKFILLLVVASVIVFSKGNAQQTGFTSGEQTAFPQSSPNLLPASPDAYSFTRYGSLPIGLNTGTAQYSLPVYTIKSGSLSHTISINYNSNGVKVDEMATRVGINWSLKAGGMITRTVLDKPDGAPGVYPDFFHGPIFWDSASTASWDLYTFIRQAGYATPPDYQPDEYSFNIDGYSGKFLKRENGEFTQFNSSGVKIEQNSNGFILIMPDGTKYFFYLSEVAKNYSYPENTTLEWVPELVPTAWYLTKILSPQRDSIVFNYSPLLSDPDSVITYKNGISQNYNSGTFDNFVINPGDYNLGTLYYPELPYIAASCESIPATQSLVQQTDNKPNFISSISFQNGSIDFKYSYREDVLTEKKLDTIKVTRSSDGKLIRCVALQYTYSHTTSGIYDTYIIPGTDYTDTDSTLRKRLFLTAFDEVSNDLSTKQRQSFEYEDINGLPPRLSFSQDRYGSFNGKVNTAWFFPNDTWFDKYIGNYHFGGDRTYNFNHAKKGILKKIIYPTGGFTKFEYEPNKTENDYAFIYNKDSVSIICDTSSYNGQEFTSDTIYFDGQRDLILKGYCEWASNPVYACEGVGCNDLDDQYYLSFEIINYSTGIPCTTSFCAGSIDAQQTMYKGGFGTSLAPGTYYIRITANRPRLRGRITLERSLRVADHSDSSGIAGIRVKSIADYISGDHPTNRREFIYGNWDDSASCSGTGLKIDINNGNEVSATRVQGHPFYSQVHDWVTCGYNSINSNSVMTNFLSENNTVIYKKVIELHTADTIKNNGGTEYEFYYDQKKIPIPIAFEWGIYIWDPIPLVPAGGSFMNNDCRTGSLKSTKVFTYQQKYGTRNILNETDNYFSIDSLHWIIDTFLVSKEVIKRERVPYWIYFCDYDIYRYWRYFGFFKQDSVVQINYTPSGQLSNKIVYFNYNSQNFQPNDIRLYSSTGETKMITRKYTCDVTAFETDYSLYQSMKNANMIGNLLEERNYISSTVSSATELIKKRMSYSQVTGLYLPSLIYNSQRAGNEYLEMSYQQFDSSGNLQQYTGKDGIITSVIWGYNKTLPVAKVVGKSYSDAISQSSINMGVVNNPSNEGAIKTELNKLRTLSGSFATTYVYSPLIGLGSQTDPNGNTTYYEYDNFNRLSLVRDKDSNVIKKICYNFQGQPVDCGFGTLAAWQAISSSCEQSGGGYTGNLAVTEKDMNPASATYNTTRNITIADLHACPLPPPCSGDDKKLINNICETGVKVCTSDFRPPGGTWHHYYHYEWSDSSTSATYTGDGHGCLEL